MQGANGRLVFLFNHSDKAAAVEFGRELEQPASRIREIMTSQAIQATGRTLSLNAEVPPQSVRIYRIDF
jgi:hypothetical protein